MPRSSSEIVATTRHYDTHAALWAARKTDSFYHESQFQKLLKRWPKKGSIIDIGCAQGIHVPLFLGMGHSLRYHGVDISKAFLKIATRRYPQLPFTLGNIADKSTLPQQKFDGFLAAAVLMHVPLPQWPTMFENLEALTKPKGVGYIVLPIVHPNTAPAADDQRHFTILSEDEQRAYLKSRHWKILDSGHMDGFSTKDVWRWYIVQLP